MRLRPARGGACRGALGGVDQRPNDPQDGNEESDPEHPVVPFTERRQPEVEPAGDVDDAQQNPEEGHIGPFELARGSWSPIPADCVDGGMSAFASSLSSGVRLCTDNPRPAIRSSSPCRCDGSMIGPVMSVLPSWAKIVIPSNADA